MSSAKNPLFAHCGRGMRKQALGKAAKTLLIRRCPPGQIRSGPGGGGGSPGSGGRAGVAAGAAAPSPRRPPSARAPAFRRRRRGLHSSAGHGGGKEAETNTCVTLTGWGHAGDAEDVWIPTLKAGPFRQPEHTRRKQEVKGGGGLGLTESSSRVDYDAAEPARAAQRAAGPRHRHEQSSPRLMVLSINRLTHSPHCSSRARRSESASPSFSVDVSVSNPPDPPRQ